MTHSNLWHTPKESKKIYIFPSLGRHPFQKQYRLDGLVVTKGFQYFPLLLSQNILSDLEKNYAFMPRQKKNNLVQNGAVSLLSLMDY